MRTWRIATVAGALVAACTLAALAVQADERAEARAPAYKVVPWPVSTAGEPYREQVEDLLNQMAGEGWRLHSEISAQGARMLVFERAANR